MIWTIADGDGNTFPGSVDWRVSFYENFSEFQRDPLRLSPQAPNLVAEFDQPTNPNWSIGVGETSNFTPLYYVEFDVRSLGIVTEPGVRQFAAITPIIPVPTPGVISGIAFAGAVNGTVGQEHDWYFTDADGLGVRPINEVESFVNHLAYRVVTTPEPNAVVALLLMLVTIRIMPHR